MGADKAIVVTVYGHDRTIDKISFSLLDASGPAEMYCEAINLVEMDGGCWICANSNFAENTWYSLDRLIRSRRLKFRQMIPALDDRSIQKILRETDSAVLARAMKNEPDGLRKKIFSNMSKNAAEMLREDMDALGPVRPEDAENSQKKITGIIRELADKGEIYYDQG